MDARELLGRGYPYVLSFQLIFGFLQLLDFFRVKYHPMIERRPSFRYFELGFSLVVPMVALLILWVAFNFLSGRFSLLFSLAPLFLCLHSVELGVSAASLFMCLMGVVFLVDRRRFADSLLWVLSFFLGLGVVHWGVLRPLGVASPLLGIATLMFNVHHVLRRVFPVLLLPFLFFWALKPVIGLRFSFPELVIGESRPNRFSVLLLAFSVYLSIFSAVYPYFSTVNPGDVDFGVDLPNYERMFQRLSDEGAGLSGFLGDTRAFFYLVLVSFRFVTGFDLHSSLRFLPVMLNPLFVAASYYFCYECFRNHKLSSWCAFLTSTGMTLTSAMSAYYLTNVLALGLVLFSLGLLFRALRDQDVRALLGASVLGVFLVFTHPWTMDQYLSGIVLLLGYILYKKDAQYRSKGLYLGVYLGVIGLAEVFKVLLFGSVGGAAASSAVVGGFLGIDEMLHDALYAFPYVHGGTLSNVTLVVLAAAGVYLYKVRDDPRWYLGFLVFLSSVVYFVSNQSRKMRLVLNLPFGLFGALIVYLMFERKNFSFIVFIVAYSLFYMLVSIGNLV